MTARPFDHRQDPPPLPRRCPGRVAATHVVSAVTPEIVHAVREWADRDD